MKHIKPRIYIMLIICIFCCNRKSYWDINSINRVIIYNTNTFENTRKILASIEGITERQDSILFAKQDSTLRANSEGQFIHDFWVQDLKSTDSILISKLIKKKTLLVFGRTHCGFGSVHIVQELPIVLKKLENEKIIFPRIILLVRESNDINDSVYFKSLYKEYKTKHNKVFIVNENDANKINAISSPTRMIISEKGQVLLFRLGATPIPTMYNELKSTFKQKDKSRNLIK